MKKQNILAGLLGLVIAFLAGCAEEPPLPAETESVSSAPAETAAVKHPSGYVPGTYTGEGKGYTGTVRVSVTVDETSILSIAVDENGEGKLGESVFPEMTAAMIAGNTVSVDAVSGATITSTGFREAVSDALSKAAK